MLREQHQKKKIDLIKKKLDIEVIVSDLPMEIQYLNIHNLKIPSIICSFGSSVDKNIPNDIQKIKKLFDGYK